MQFPARTGPVQINPIPLDQDIGFFGNKPVQPRLLLASRIPLPFGETATINPPIIPAFPQDTVFHCIWSPFGRRN